MTPSWTTIAADWQDAAATLLPKLSGAAVGLTTIAELLVDPVDVTEERSNVRGARAKLAARVMQTEAKLREHP